MSLTSDNMMKLMAYADGELEAGERAEAEKLLATDADAARFVAQIASLGTIVETGHEHRVGKAIESFDIADAVMAAVEKEPKPAKVPATAKIMSLASSRASKAAEKSAQGGGLRVGIGIAAALALAASIVFYARPKETPMSQTEPAAESTTSPAPSEALSVAVAPGTVAPLAPSPASGPGVEVSAVESPGHSVSVFYLPSANELTTSVVVWVDETSGDKK